MDLSERYNGLWNGWPVRAARTVVVQGARPVWRRAVGVSLTGTEVRQRDAERAKQKAVLGAAIIRESEDRKDPDLRHLGEATAAMAVANAYDNPNDLVTQAAVADVAAPLLGRVGDNPYVDPTVADKVTAVLKESDAVSSSQTE